MKISRPPAGPASKSAPAARWGRYARRNRRDRLTVVIHYRGGAEAYWAIEARGSKGYFTGVTALHDAFQEITDGAAWYLPDE